jgi:prepilin-type processing-associated H-X9-DG protein
MTPNSGFPFRSKIQSWLPSYNNTFIFRVGANFATSYTLAGNYPPASQIAGWRHGRVVNFVFLDGHAEPITLLNPAFKYPFGKISYLDYNPVTNADPIP